jgi:integrase
MRTSIEVNFKLKSQANSDGSKSIQAKAYFNGERLVISSEFTISPNNWANGVLTEKFAATKEGKLINRQLSQIEANIKRAYQLVMDSDGKANVSKVRRRFEELSGKKKPGGLTLFQCIDLHITKAKNGELKTKDGKPYSDGTIMIYERCRNYLCEYAKKYLGKSEPSFDDVLNENFYGKFTRFLQTTQSYYTTKNGAKRRIGKLNANSISGMITRLKTFLNASRGHFTSPFDFSKEFKVQAKPQKKVYLNLDELRKIEQLDLSDNPTLSQVREWLLITCFTGLRVSDFKRLRPEHFNLKNNTITIDAQKTGTPSYIPLFPEVKRIIERYKQIGGFLPRPYADAFLNRKFKEVVLEAGITDKVIVVEYVGNKMIEVTVPKFEKIFTKTGRVSFVSNMLSLGFSREQIKKVTGHKSDRVFDGYDQLSGEANAETVLVEFKKRTAKLTAV